MPRAERLARQVEAAFGPLAMARELLAQVIPNNDDPHSVERATELAEALIETAAAALTPPPPAKTRRCKMARPVAAPARLP